VEIILFFIFASLIPRRIIFDVNYLIIEGYFPSLLSHRCYYEEIITITIIWKTLDLNLEQFQTHKFANFIKSIAIMNIKLLS